MSYTDEHGVYHHQEGDPADPGGGFSELLNKIAKSLGPAVASLTAAAIAANPTLLEAVEDLVRDQNFVRFGDPAVPEVDQFPNNPAYFLREFDRAGRMTRGIYASDGTQYMPLARVDKLKIAAQGSVDWGSPGSGVSFAVIDENNRMSDLAIGDDGHFLPHVIEHLSDALAGGGSDIGGYDIIVIAGQSNSAKASYLEVDGLREEDSRISQWNGTAIVPVPANEVYLGAEFGRAYARLAARTGRRVLIVPTGVGSVGFTSTSINPPPEGYFYNANGTLDRTLTADANNRYSRMIALVNQARSAAGAGSRIAAMVWSQGESDRRLTQAQYATKLDDLITSARATWGTPDLPVVIGSMTPEVHSDHEDIEQIARALADTPRRLARTGFVWGPTNGHRYFQTVHFSYAGQIERAARMAQEGLLEARANVAANEPVAAQNLRVTRSGGTATLDWDRPLCHVDDVVVQYSTNGGASWQAATIDMMHGSRATAAVAAASAVRFRITVTNSIGTSMPAETNG